MKRDDPGDNLRRIHRGQQNADDLARGPLNEDTEEFTLQVADTVRQWDSHLAALLALAWMILLAVGLPVIVLAWRAVL